MRDSKLNHYDLLRVGHVKRWHNVNTARPQTVGEHSYMVAIIALALYDKVVGASDTESISDICSLTLACLFHDSPEVVTGDMPTPAKRLLEEIACDKDLFDKMDALLMPLTPFINTTPAPAIKDFVDLADKIESAVWIDENGVGNHAKAVSQANWFRLQEMVSAYHRESPSAGWYQAVNEVLKAMGTSHYVHDPARVTNL